MTTYAQGKDTSDPSFLLRFTPLRIQYQNVKTRYVLDAYRDGPLIETFHERCFVTYIGLMLKDSKIMFDMTARGAGMNPNIFAMVQNVLLYVHFASSVKPKSKKKTNAKNTGVHSMDLTDRLYCHGLLQNDIGIA